MFCVYTIFNKKNGKIYVGKTNAPKNRWLAHISVAFNLKSKERYAIHKAIFKYGKNNFEFTVIQEYTIEKWALDAEKYWIKFLNTRNKKFGYNLTDGGDGTSGRKQIVSPETRAKISATLIKRAKEIPIEQRRKAPHTEEAKEKMSIAHKGKKFSPEKRENHAILMNKVFATRRDNGINHPMFGKNNLKNAGEKCASAKFTEEQVLKIRTDFDVGNISMYKLAKNYNVSKSAIRQIIYKLTWKHI